MPGGHVPPGVESDARGIYARLTGLPRHVARTQPCWPVGSRRRIPLTRRELSATVRRGRKGADRKRQLRLRRRDIGKGREQRAGEHARSKATSNLACNRALGRVAVRCGYCTLTTAITGDIM